MFVQRKQMVADALKRFRAEVDTEMAKADSDLMKEKLNNKALRQEMGHLLVGTGGNVQGHVRRDLVVGTGGMYRGHVGRGLVVGLEAWKPMIPVGVGYPLLEPAHPYPTVPLLSAS